MNKSMMEDFAAQIILGLLYCGCPSFQAMFCWVPLPRRWGVAWLRSPSVDDVQQNLGPTSHWPSWTTWLWKMECLRRCPCTISMVSVPHSGISAPSYEYGVVKSQCEVLKSPLSLYFWWGKLKMLFFAGCLMLCKLSCLRVPYVQSYPFLAVFSRQISASLNDAHGRERNVSIMSDYFRLRTCSVQTSVVMQQFRSYFPFFSHSKHGGVCHFAVFVPSIRGRWQGRGVCKQWQSPSGRCDLAHQSTTHLHSNRQALPCNGSKQGGNMR